MTASQMLGLKAGAATTCLHIPLCRDLSPETHTFCSDLCPEPKSNQDCGWLTSVYGDVGWSLAPHLTF